MKNSLLKIYLFSFIILSDFIMFAQGPGDDDGGGGLEDPDAPPAPINGKLLWLAIAGVIFAIYTYRNHKKVNAA